MNFDQALAMTQLGLQKTPDLNVEAGLERESEELVVAAYRRATGRGRTFTRNDLYMRALEPYPEKAISLLKEFIEKRVTGYPLAYILGYRYFLNHEYVVTPDVLIPRFETEVLVFEAYQWLRRRGIAKPSGLEIGVGSGIISLELLKLIPDLKMLATDISEGAITCAKKNRETILSADEQGRLKLVKVENTPNKLFSEERLSKAGLFDFIISNPPYLAGHEEATSQVVMHEPHEALFPNSADPLIFYRSLFDLSLTALKPHGFVFLELPHERAAEIEKLYAQKFKTQIVEDLTSRPRVLIAEMGGFVGDSQVH